MKSLLVAAVGTALAMPAPAQQAAGDFPDVFGPQFESQARGFEPARRHHPPAGLDTLGRLRHWNEVALDANGLDHTPVEEGELRVYGEQVGPGRTARALAIIHIALFEAVNAIEGGYRSYLKLPPCGRGVSMDAAIAQAARDTMVALYPSQTAWFNQLLVEDMAQIPNGRPKSEGRAMGARAAAAILTKRSEDGSQYKEPVIGEDYFPGEEPGIWRQDPISQIPVALGAYWGEVKPFTLSSATAYRVDPPPALTSGTYATAYHEVKNLGGDGITTPTSRTAKQTEIGIFWGYDGTPGLGTPPRLYNQIAVQIARMRHSDTVETARLLALVNVAMADSGIACWESKYFYNVWRPVTGIREADAGTGPTGGGDGNPLTLGDQTFSPLGAQASNLTGPNFTPPFPAYPSGHATFGAALFQVLRRFYGTDKISFTFVSDELNGVTLDNYGVPRPLSPRSFKTLSRAEEENGQSRIYEGIHWAFDKTAGIKQGRKIADHVFDSIFQPLRHDSHPPR